MYLLNEWTDIAFGINYWVSWGLGFPQQSFSWQEKKLSQSSAVEWHLPDDEAESRLELRAHTSVLQSPHCSCTILAWWSRYNHMRQIWREFLLLNSVGRLQRVERTVGTSPWSLNVSDKDTEVPRSVAAQSHPGGGLGWKTKFITFQSHDTVKSVLRVLSWKGCIWVPPHWSEKCWLSHIDSWWAIMPWR